jgi:hypothetical protein
MSQNQTLAGPPGHQLIQVDPHRRALAGSGPSLGLMLRLSDRGRLLGTLAIAEVRLKLHEMLAIVESSVGDLAVLRRLIESARPLAGRQASVPADCRPTAVSLLSPIFCGERGAKSEP